MDNYLVISIFLLNIILSPYKIAFVGDSITKNGYPTVLNCFKFAQQINLGVNSAGIQNTDTIVYIKTEEYKTLISKTFDIVVIMFGVNDASKLNSFNEEIFIKDYETLIENIRLKNSSTKIIIVSPTFVYNLNNVNQEVLERIVIDVDELSNKLNLTYFNMYEYTKYHPELFFDGIHTNQKGSTFIANKICELLEN